MAHRDSFPTPAELVPGAGQLHAQVSTSLGAFTVNLLEQFAPNSVANFVGLATGQIDWVDAETGDAGSGPYYDGVIFHRVISGFMLQGGDPTGTGRGGPGYTFDDECHPDARHTGPGILSMANRGARGGRGTNGSQFFVTLGPTPHLDGKHTVFGEVVDGLDVVETIGRVKTGAGDRPVEPVVIQSISFKRV